MSGSRVSVANWSTLSFPSKPQWLGIKLKLTQVPLLLNKQRGLKCATNRMRLKASCYWILSILMCVLKEKYESRHSPRNLTAQLAGVCYKTWPWGVSEPWIREPLKLGSESSETYDFALLGCKPETIPRQAHSRMALFYTGKCCLIIIYIAPCRGICIIYWHDVKPITTQSY